MTTFPVLGVPIGITTMRDVVSLVNKWIRQPSKARLVTFTNVHMVVEASVQPAFRSMLQTMDLNCPDGFPVYWLTRHAHGREVEKISGPDFMQTFCEQSAGMGHRHFLYGGAPGVSDGAAATLRSLYPGIDIVGTYCPPFRALTADERADVIETIRQSHADLVWVCLGCPKQEKWIHEIQTELPGKVFLAVGQALDILAGRTQRAPDVLSRYGGEWMYRLVKEPRRLWKRYLVTNVLFVLLLARERMVHCMSERPAKSVRLPPCESALRNS